MSGCRWYYSWTKRRGIQLLFLLELNKWIRTITGRDIASLGDRCLYSPVLATDFAKWNFSVVCNMYKYSVQTKKHYYTKIRVREVRISKRIEIARCRMYITMETYETDMIKYARSTVARVGNRQSGIAMYIAFLATRERWNTRGYRERK